MTNRTKDRLEGLALVLGIIIVLVVLWFLVAEVNGYIEYWHNRAIELEAELADTRAEKEMFQSTLKDLVEGKGQGSMK